MTQQVEVRFADGSSEVVEADDWLSCEDGRLDVLATESSDSRVVATFAPRTWTMVQRVVIVNRVGEKLSVGQLTIDVKPSERLAALCDWARTEQADDSGKSDSQIFVSVADIEALQRLIDGTRVGSHPNTQ